MNSNWNKLKGKIQVAKKSAPSQKNKTGAPSQKTEKSLEFKNSEKIGKYLAMDCEMVGVGDDGKRSVLARVSIVNYHGHVILDEFVLPLEKVTDYRTWCSGVTPKLLATKGKDFAVVQKQVADILKGKILIGHALKNDLDALLLTHDSKMIRDTSKYRPLKHAHTNRPKALKKLALEYLDIEIQSGEHCSIDDAKAALEIYKKHRTDWENKLKSKKHIDK
jgi:RNA exonuclease 4